MASPPPTPISCDLNTVVNQAIVDERSWTVREIAERHGLSYWTVYRQLKGKPGWLPFGRAVRITDSLYRSWIKSIALNGTTSA